MRGLHTLGDSQLSLQSRPGNGINEARTGSKASRKSRAETSHAAVERGINASRPLRRPLPTPVRERFADGDEGRASNCENPGFGISLSDNPVLAPKPL